MAGRRLENFDYFVTADLPTRFTAINGAPTISAGNGRNSTASLRTTNWASIGWDLTLTPQQTWIVGFSFKPTAIPATTRTLIAFFDTSIAHVSFGLKADGTIAAFRGGLAGTLLGTSTNVLAAGTTYYLEFKVTIDDSAGVVGFRVNGVVDATLNLTAQDTRNAGNATANVIEYMSIGGTSAAQTADMDDLYICDGTVGDGDQPNNDYLGDIRVELSSVAGAGTTTQWTPLSSTNASNVDDAAPDGDTTYNSSATVAQVDTFAMTDLVTTTGVVQFVEILNYARKTDAGAAAIAPVLRSGGSDFVGSDDALGTTYTYVGQVYDVNPATGLPFTIAEVNAIEAGYKKTV